MSGARGKKRSATEKDERAKMVAGLVGRCEVYDFEATRLRADLHNLSTEALRVLWERLI